MAPVQHLSQAAGDKSLTAEEVDRFIELSRAARGATP